MDTWRLFFNTESQQRQASYIILLGWWGRRNNSCQRYPGAKFLQFVVVTKRGFAEVFKLRILKWGDYPRLSNWTLNIMTRVLIRGRPKEIWWQRGEGNVIMAADTGICVWERGRGHEQGNARNVELEAGKGKGTDWALEPTGNIILPTP